MTPEDQQHLMLGDALGRIAANPTASHLWLHLAALVQATSNTDLLMAVVRTITAQVSSHGLAGFYRAGTLDLITGDPDYLPQACACLQSLVPLDFDRCSEFFDIAWQRALLQARDRNSYLQRLEAIGLPALSQQIGRELATRMPATAPAPALQLRRVALVAPHLATPAHPPTQMVLDHADVLLRHGIEVNLFSCQEAQLPDADHLLGTGVRNVSMQTDLQPWLDTVGTAVLVYCADTRFSLLRRWTDMHNAVQAYGPDLVLFIGLHAGLVRALYRSYPVLGLATNSVAPLVPMDAWLTAQPELAGSTASPWGAGFAGGVACHHPFRARRRDAGAALSRGSLGLADDALLMMTMGTHLEVKVAGAWAQRMRAAMERHPRLVWLLLGDEGQLPPALAGLPPQRLRLQGKTPHAMQYLAASDFYLHPPIMGGGFSVADAMSLGIPTLALAGADGGDKVGADAVADLDDYFAMLDALIADPALRQACGQRMQNRFDTELDLAASGPSLLAAGETAMQHYRQRIKQTTA